MLHPAAGLHINERGSTSRTVVRKRVAQPYTTRCGHPNNPLRCRKNTLFRIPDIDADASCVSSSCRKVREKRQRSTSVLWARKYILSFITLVLQIVFVGISLLPEWNEDPRFEGDKLGYRS